MKKIYKLGVTLGATISIVAPLATVVACGGTKGAPTGGPSNDNGQAPIDSATKVDKSGILAPVNLVPYSADSLRNDAKAIGHAQGWIKGPTYHSVSTFVSFVNQLADSFGYSSTKDTNNQTRFESDFKDWTILDDKNHQQVFDSVKTPTPTLTFLNSLTQNGALTPTQQANIALVFGDNESISKNDFDDLNITSSLFKSINKKTFTFDFNKSDENAEFTKYSVLQTSVPGQVELNVYSEKNELRKILINNVTPTYPIVNKNVLQTEFAPYVKSAILKFIEIYKDDPMAKQASKYITPEIINKIKFLIDANTSEENGQKVFKIDDEKLLTYLNNLNNGSTDWLAMKAFYKGFDETMTLVDMLPFNGNSHYGLQQEIEGIKDISSILGVIKWAHYNSFDAIVDVDHKSFGVNYPEISKALHPYANTFYPSMTVSEMNNKNNVSTTKDVTDFFAKYSGDTYKLIKNDSAIVQAFTTIENSCNNILGFDSTNVEATKWLSDAMQIKSNSATTNDVAISDKQVTDIKNIEQQSTALEAKLKSDQISRTQKVEADWNSLKLVGNGQISNLKVDDLLSIDEVKQLLLSGQKLPDLPAHNSINKGEFVYRYGIQPSVKSFTPVTPKGDEKVFKVISHENDILKLEVQFTADKESGWLLFPKTTKPCQFEISDVKNQ